MQELQTDNFRSCFYYQTPNLDKPQDKDLHEIYGKNVARIMSSGLPIKISIQLMFKTTLRHNVHQQSTWG